MCSIRSFNGSHLKKYTFSLSFRITELKPNKYIHYLMSGYALKQGSASKFGIGPKQMYLLDGGPEHSQMII